MKGQCILKNGWIQNSLEFHFDRTNIHFSVSLHVTGLLQFLWVKKGQIPRKNYFSLCSAIGVYVSDALCFHR